MKIDRLIDWLIYA